MSEPTFEEALNAVICHVEQTVQGWTDAYDDFDVVREAHRREVEAARLEQLRVDHAHLVEERKAAREKALDAAIAACVTEAYFEAHKKATPADRFDDRYVRTVNLCVRAVAALKEKRDA